VGLFSSPVLILLSGESLADGIVPDHCGDCDSSGTLIQVINPTPLRRCSSHCTMLWVDPVGTGPVHQGVHLSAYIFAH
jgi:hypothetical protein